VLNTIRVKPGHDAAFTERWSEIVKSHETAKIDEHWAVYSVSAGAPTGTYLFIYARKSLAELDTAGVAHTADAYRDAVGDEGRAKNAQVFGDVVEFDQTNHYAFKPKMSLVSKAWVEADPTFWTPAPPPMTAKKGEKK
jgi:hypothetical protein